MAAAAAAAAAAAPACASGAENLCGICFEIVTDFSRGAIECGHLFCFRCIERWARATNVCPVCKTRIRRITGTDGRQVLIHEDREREIDEEEQREVLDPQHWISDADVLCVGDARCKWRCAP